MQSERIDLVHVVQQPGRLPQVLRLESYARGQDGVAALASLRRQKGLDRYRCTTTLANGEYQLLQLEAPEVPAAELKDAVRWKVQEMLDFPVESATLDVLDIPQPAGAGRAHQIFSVVADNAVLEPRIRLFQDARVDLSVIDVLETAQRNVAALFEDENRGLAFLNFDDEGSLLTFTYQGELYTSRRVDISVRQLAQADEERRQQLYERIGLELQRSLDNFERMYTFISVSRVLLGPCTAIPGLLEYLKDFVFVPVAMADLSQVLDMAAIPELADPGLQGQRLTLIGAALRQEAA